MDKHSRTRVDFICQGDFSCVPLVGTRGFGVRAGGSRASNEDA